MDNLLKELISIIYINAEYLNITQFISNLLKNLLRTVIQLIFLEMIRKIIQRTIMMKASGSYILVRLRIRLRVIY